MEFHASSEAHPGALVVRAVGDVDLASAPVLKETIAAAWAPPQALIVDATEVGFIDSTGLGVLVAAVQRARDEGGQVAIAVSADRVRKVLAITGLDTFVAVHPTVAEALRATETP
jgi:anti-sigma B factor antagonist